MKNFVTSLVKKYQASASKEEDASPGKADEVCITGWSLGSDGVVKLVCFPEDKDEVSEMREEINSFCQAYHEEWWKLPEFPPERKTKLNKVFSADDFSAKLRQTHSLSEEPKWWKDSKTFEWHLQLCGNSEDVTAAIESMSNQCKPEEVLEFDVAADQILLKLLNSNKAKLQEHTRTKTMLNLII